MAAGDRTGDRDKALDAALANIEKQFGKGSVMRLGDEVRAPLEGCAQIQRAIAAGYSPMFAPSRFLFGVGALDSGPRFAIPE